MMGVCGAKLTGRLLETYRNLQRWEYLIASIDTGAPAMQNACFQSKHNKKENMQTTKKMMDQRNACNVVAVVVKRMLPARGFTLRED